MASDQTKFVLDEDRIPRAWYNIAADLPVPPAPVLHPGTVQPIGPADLAPLFPMALIAQEVSTDREIEIPDPVREAYALYRPSAALPGAPAREGARYAGPHLLQVRGRAARPAATSPTPRSPRRTTTRRRASRGSRPRPAPASGGARWRSPGRCSASRSRSTWSGRATTRSRTAGSSWRPTARRSSPARAPTTEYGRQVLAETPDNPGSLGIAISEAVEDAATREDTKYSLGSVLDIVLLHQTVIGQEAIEQMAMAGEEPDVIIALRRRRLQLRRADVPVRRAQAPRRATVPRHRRRARGGADADPRRLRLRLRRHRQDGARSSRCTRSATTSCPSRSTPAACATTACRRSCRLLKEQGLIEARAVHQTATFEAGVQFARSRGHPAGARSRPTPSRSPSTRRCGAKEEGAPDGHPVQPLRPRPLRPGRLRDATSRARSRTTSTRPRPSPRRSSASRVG